MSSTDQTGDELPVLVEGFESFVEIGSGGFSTVYGAVETRLRRPVAIKVLHTEMDNPEERETFERECRVMGILSRHPHIVTVYSDADTVDGAPCLVMERYDGNYRERIANEGRLPLPELLDVGVKIAGALQSAHDSGVLHRDIKPHNLFVSDFGEPALGDFGISSIDDERSSTITTAFSIAYCSPEVLDDEPSTFLSDVYSLSAAVFHMASGAAPFAAPQITDVIRQILDSEHVPMLDRADAPASLARLLESGLARDVSLRPDSAGAFGAALQEIQSEMGLTPTRMALRREERYDATEVEVREPATRGPRGDESPKTGDDPMVDSEATILPGTGDDPSRGAPSGGESRVVEDPEATIVPDDVDPVRVWTIEDSRPSPDAALPLTPSREPESRDAAPSHEARATPRSAELDEEPVEATSWRHHVGIDLAIGVVVVALVVFALARLL